MLKRGIKSFINYSVNTILIITALLLPRDHTQVATLHVAHARHAGSVLSSVTKPNANTYILPSFP